MTVEATGAPAERRWRVTGRGTSGAVPHQGATGGGLSTEDPAVPRHRPGDGTAAGAGATTEARNEVVLVGRVSGLPEERSLPSGDALVSWRVVVDRPAPRRAPPPGVRVVTVDTLDCVAWKPSLRRAALRLTDGDVVYVEGSLRRRFWRSGLGAASRTEVEVAAVRRVRRRPQ